MSRALAGKRYFHALGAAAADRGWRLCMIDMRGMPLWARNATVNGFFKTDPRRWTAGYPPMPMRRKPIPGYAAVLKKIAF